MKTHLVFSRMTAGLAVLALSAGWVGSARADLAYGFASETISNLSISPTVTATGTVVTSTTSATTVNGSGLSNSDATDVPQTYQGGAPPSPQNNFTRYAPGAPPVSPVGNFTRGDALIANLGLVNNSGSVVAESYLNGTTGSETGSGGLQASFSFTPATTGALVLSYNYANDAYVVTTGTGSASAGYNFDITIKNAAGAVVFSSDSPNTNLTLAAPPQGGEIIRTGLESITTSSLTGGQNYTLIFSENANTSVRLAAVPEPGPLTLAAVGAITVGCVYRRRRAAKV